MSRISIVIPNFNKGRYISYTLTSIKNQTFTDWECIIVDDGSTDDSITIIEDFINKDFRFSLIKRDANSVKGGSSCRNIGLYRAIGEYVVFFDSDDLMLSHFLDQRLKFIETFTNVDFAVFPCGTFINKIGDSKDIWRVKKGYHLEQFLSFELPWNIMSPIWRRQFLQKLEGFDINFPLLQDGEMHTRALLTPGVSYKIFPDEAPDCYYRISFERKGHDMSTQLHLHLKGALMYIDKMSVLLIKENKRDKLKYLRGTAFALISLILWINSKKHEKSNEFDLILTQLMNEMDGRTEVFGKRNRRFLSIYIKLYKGGLYKLKGFNYLSKKMYIYFL